MNSKLRMALIGQGFMGRAHSNAWRQVDNFFEIPFDLRLKVICARDRTRLERAAARWGWEETASDWRAVVERDDIDLVDICVPNALHAAIATAAAEAGKMVLCEKPLATSSEEGARMAAAARGVRNGVWYNYRRVPAVAFARRLIDEGRVGRVFHYRAAYLQEWAMIRRARRVGRWRKRTQAAACLATCSRTSSIPRCISTAPSVRLRR